MKALIKSAALKLAHTNISVTTAVCRVESELLHHTGVSKLIFTALRAARVPIKNPPKVEHLRAQWAAYGECMHTVLDFLHDVTDDEKAVVAAAGAYTQALFDTHEHMFGWSSPGSAGLAAQA